MAGPAVIELARAALRRLGEAAPTPEAADALQAIEKTAKGPPYTVAIAGELGARTSLLDFLAGERLFDPSRRDPPRVVMTMRRGAITALRARKRDGSVETHTLGATASGALVVEELLIVEEALAEQHAPVVEIPRAETATLIVRRPPWWAVWLWVMLWIRSWQARRRESAPRTPVSPPSPKPEPKPPAPQPPQKVVVDPRKQFVETLHRLFADQLVDRVSLEVGGGPLPENLVLIELPSGADPKVLGAAGADACVVACGGNGIVKTAQLDAVLAILPHLFAVGPVAIPADPDRRIRQLADFAAVAPALVKLASTERAIAVGARASAALKRGRTTLDRFIADAELGFRKRIEVLEARRIPNVDELVTTQLARLRPAIVEHAHRSLRRALERLDSEITRLATEWSARFHEVTATDALRTAAAKLDEDSPVALQTVRSDAKRLLIDDLTEHARAKYLELVSALREGTSRTDPLPAWLTIEIVLGDAVLGTDLGSVAPRLTSLFKSLDAIKRAADEQLQQRIETLRQLVTAHFVDSEPKLEPAVSATISIALRADAERHGVWLEAELLREHAAIESERIRVAALVKVRDATLADERKLVASIEALERELQ